MSRSRVEGESSGGARPAARERDPAATHPPRHNGSIGRGATVESGNMDHETDATPEDERDRERRCAIEGLSLQLANVIEAWSGEWRLGYAEVLGILSMLQSDILEGYRQPRETAEEPDDDPGFPPQAPN